MTVADASLASSCERFLDVSSEANTGGMMVFPVFWSADWLIDIMELFPKAIELRYFSCFIYQEWVDFGRYGHFWKDLWISQTLFNQTKRTSSLPTLHINILYFYSKLTGWPVDTRIKHQEVISRSCDSSAIESICSPDVIPIALSTQWLSCPKEPMESWESDAWWKAASALEIWRPTENLPHNDPKVSSVSYYHLELLLYSKPFYGSTRKTTLGKLIFCPCKWVMTTCILATCTRHATCACGNHDAVHAPLWNTVSMYLLYTERSLFAFFHSIGL